MRRCRSDVSDAWRTTPWVRVPYPFQWSSCISLQNSSFCQRIINPDIHCTSATFIISCFFITCQFKPSNTSCQQRDQGTSAFIAGLLGTGTGSTTLTENIQTPRLQWACPTIWLYHQYVVASMYSQTEGGFPLLIQATQKRILSSLMIHCSCTYGVCSEQVLNCRRCVAGDGAGAETATKTEQSGSAGGGDA